VRTAKLVTAPIQKHTGAVVTQYAQSVTPYRLDHPATPAITAAAINDAIFIRILP
jgi:hypothetical protein